MNPRGSHKWLKCGVLALLMLSGGAAFAQRGGGGGHGGFGGGGFHGGGVARAGGHAVAGFRGGYRGGYGGYYGRGGYGWRGGYYGGYYGGYWGGYGALGLGLFFGALPFAYSTYWWDGVPYYYADNNYYQWDGTADAYETVAPPAEVAAQAQGTSAADPATTADLFAYPRANQSAQQQAKDRQECSQWATKQTSAQAATTQPSTSAAARTHSDYLRAEAACLTARDYSVR